MRIALAASALAAGLAVAAQAQNYDATDLNLQRFVGVVEIETASVDRIAVEYDPGEGLIDAPRFEVEGSALVVTQLRGRVHMNCRSRGGQRRLEVGRNRFHPIEDYGRLIVRVPAGAHLEIVGGAVEGEIGDIASIDVRTRSCTRVMVGDVTRDAAIAVNGSGDVSAGNVGGRLDVGVNGSGDVRVGAVGGDVSVAVNGSGDTTVGAVEGDLIVAVNGSGDVRVASVSGSIATGTQGSGDIEIASASGESTSVMIGGSGDVRVFGGEVGRIQVRAMGSGDVRFGGVAGDVELTAAGSGDVYVAEVTGQVRSSGRGSGRVHVGQR